MSDREAAIRYLRRFEQERNWPRLGHCADVLEAAEAELAAAREREAKLREALRPIIHEYNLWAEDATDGEFRLWDLDRLVMAIVNARARADGGGET